MVLPHNLVGRMYRSFRLPLLGVRHRFRSQPKKTIMITNEIYKELAKAITQAWEYDHDTNFSVGYEGENLYIEMKGTLNTTYVDDSFTHEFGIMETGHNEPIEIASIHLCEITRVDDDNNEFTLNDDNIDLDTLNEYFQNPRKAA